MSVTSPLPDNQQPPKLLATAMKLTPIAIRQHTFEKGLRGYKVEEVDAFLSSLSEEWERITSDYKMLRMQLELAEKELNKLKEVEMTLFRTLKTAEDTSTQITDQANKAGEKYIGEAKQKADEVLADARKRSAIMVQDAENQARYLKDNILNDLKALEHDFKALENYKENLATQIRTLAGNAVDSVDRFEKKFTKQNLKGKIDEAAAQIKDDQQPAGNGKHDTVPKNLVDVRPEAVSQARPTADLPPLTQREQAIPEAIPVDDSLVAKLNEAIQPLTRPEAVQVVSTDAANEAATESKISESIPFPADPASSEQTPTTLVEERQPAKGGSFFDQI